MLLSGFLGPEPARAASVTLIASDALGTSSFTNAANWSNAALPNSTNNYLTSTNSLRTPADGNNYTFGGNSLTLQPGTVSGYSLIYKGSATANTYTIKNLTNSGGLIRSGASSGNTCIIAGNMIVAGNSTIEADQSPFVVSANLSGGAILTNLNPGPQTYGSVTYSGTNSAFNGELLVGSSGILIFGNSNSVPGNPASSNPGQITLGAGATLEDLAGITLSNPNGGLALAGNATISVPGLNVATMLAVPISGGNAGLVKSGAGALYLDAAAAYTGTTVVTNGTLAGVGSLSGPLAVGSAGNLGAGNPGATVGTLTIKNTLTLQGNVTLRINNTGGKPTNDQVVVNGSVAYGGELTVTNITSDGTPLTTNSTFQLFNVSGSSSGSFSAGIAGSPGANLVYAFDPTNGVLSVVTNPPLPPQAYAPPSDSRTDVLLDSGWRFWQQNVSGAQATNFDDSTWTNVNLPHCWDIADGQSYPASNYYQGAAWYRTHFTPSGSFTNRQFFLKFDGAFLVTDVYLNGNFLGEHDGGFAAFVFDVTPYLKVGADNVLAVEVNNAVNTNVPPLAADFTFWGGIYRDVHLLVTDPLQVSPLDYGSPGVYLKPTSVGVNSANLQVTTVVSNANPSAAGVTVRAVITDAATNIVALITNLLTLPAGTVSNVVGSAVIANPHLWNGLADPYLYRAYVEVYNGTNLTDLVSQPLGFRWFRIDPVNGFSLNGQPYDLHGVAMHQDWLNCGWALTNAQRATNFMLLKQLGATAVRLCHYEHDDGTYQLADQNGIVLWSEIPLIDYITQSAAFYTNAEQQLRELIRQRYNHPSVICWGTFNEITLSSGPSPTNLVQQLVQLEAQEDSTRPSAGASLAGNGDATSWMPQVVCFNEYFGWYESPLNGIASWSDSIHATYPANAIGITEYGAGASIYQHSENPVAWPTTTGGLYHPEEWQDLVHETNWALMKARPALWFKTAWNMCDFASDGRDEGDTPGRNDKGLITYDRQIPKDVFYFYQANWTTNPMVYITGHTFTNRLTNITAKVYANCAAVELFVDGVSQGSQTSSNCVFSWPVTLRVGTNAVSAIGTLGGIQVTDALSWVATSAPISQGRAVTASSYQDGNDPTNGNDGNFSTRWAAADGTFPQWWQVDLGSVQCLTNATIYWYDSSSRAYQYQIEISSDGVNFILVVDNSDNTGLGNTSDSFAAYARYVRVTVLGVTPSGGWASFYECQLLGGGLPPPVLSFQELSGALRLSWPLSGGNWSLQAQTNGFGQGLGTNWVTIQGSSATNQMDLPINPGNPAVFYRLSYRQ
jgi:beta-galactosidase